MYDEIETPSDAYDNLKKSQARYHANDKKLEREGKEEKTGKRENDKKRKRQRKTK